ncbi:MAG: antitoxin Xre/MbcA/ParS toxin-binding domain-containing protein [Aeromonas sp.]|uniref:antitoxin Xre/MbcA/ParS toxin-binding domain-containing protein n=1 Tax=Aeromonas sp. TaxID=647 RepID=UPI0029106DAB|nr:antitoxin Xre/MbcA/ParS toxin-binding domain-containing protein [Aeromonas sp.]MDU4189519.1 antitoxin Xre/MbcA/ParS toxin-binding domain-containing protein [Aeromonas sp.]
MSLSVYQPSTQASSAHTLMTTLNIPQDPLSAHLWIVANTDSGLICRLAGISRSTVARKLRIEAPLSISQGARVYGVVQALEAVLFLHRNNTARALSWLHRPAWGLGGKRPAEVLSTALGAQAVIVLVGRIQHGVCT